MPRDNVGSLLMRSLGKRTEGQERAEEGKRNEAKANVFFFTSFPEPQKPGEAHFLLFLFFLLST